MMTIEQYLLGKVAEEAAEVIVRANKAARFGLTEVQPGQPHDNRERLRDELEDLLVAVQLLQDLRLLPVICPYWDKHAARDTKIAKVLKYYDYSVQLGMVEAGLQEALAARAAEEA